MIRVLSVTMKKQFIQFLPVSVRCILQVPQMKALMKMWMRQMKVQSKRKSGNFFWKIISLLVISKFMFAVVIRMMVL